MAGSGDRLALYQEAFEAYAPRIAAGRRHLSEDDAVAIVLDACAARGIDVDPGPARNIARRLLRHPLWSFRHPLRTFRGD